MSQNLCLLLDFQSFNMFEENNNIWVYFALVPGNFTHILIYTSSTLAEQTTPEALGKFGDKSCATIQDSFWLMMVITIW